jgi:hypothetical protein
MRSPIDPKITADQQGTIPSFPAVFIAICECWNTNLLNELKISLFFLPHEKYFVKRFLSIYKRIYEER